MLIIRYLFLLCITFNFAAAQDKPLPDGELIKGQGYVTRLIAPTTLYKHGVLGDAIEAKGFSVRKNGFNMRYLLPDDAVFEDRRARLIWQKGQNNPPSILVIKSYLTKGSALALYDIVNQQIVPIAESEAIGTPNRWMNIIGLADFLGNGNAQIAVVVMPHLLGSLRLYTVEGNRINAIARTDGYTNHIIGERDLDLAKIIYTPKPVIIIPILNRTEIAFIGFKDEKFVEINRISLPTPIRVLKSATNTQLFYLDESGKEHRLSYKLTP